MMKFETEHYKLALSVRWVVKRGVPHQKCVHCGGSGLEQSSDEMGFGPKPVCEYCHGSGESSTFYDAPAPPEIDKKFLEDLKNWFDNYGKDDNTTDRS
jgi:hypothetical protein